VVRATIPGTLEREMEALLDEIGWCAKLARDPDRRAARVPSVSGWSVAEQLEHLLLADRRILDWLEAAARGDAPRGRGGPSATGRWVLWVGAIPRGRGTAPDGTRPEGLAPDTLATEWSTILDRTRALRKRSPELRASPGRWEHPLLGSFGTWHWTRFARVHHRHHGAIITEILARAGE
jgi:hypothetical protein